MHLSSSADSDRPKPELEEEQQQEEAMASLAGTEFKRMYQLFKRSCPVNQLPDVIDPHGNCENSSAVVRKPKHFGAEKQRLLDRRKLEGIRPLSEWVLSIFPRRPGLFHIHNVFTEFEQLRWLRRCMFEYPEPPNITNLSNIGAYTGRNVFRRQKGTGHKLRWATLGNHYNWDERIYPDPRKSNPDPLPEALCQCSELISEVLDLGPFSPDTAIINYYPRKATLSPHVDKSIVENSEHDLSRPLISLSFGQPAVFLIGGHTLHDPVDALLLRSGDVLVMSGTQRLAYHALARVLDGQVQFDPVAAEMEMDNKGDVLDYANQCRVNITVRQVADGQPSAIAQQLDNGCVADTAS